MPEQGYLALLLHAHLPHVRHPEYPDFLEEDWLYEAVTETYLPLIQMMHGMQADGVPFQLTMSITPTLCSMLQDQLLQERCVRYMDRAIALSELEMERPTDHPQVHDLARFYHQRFSECRRLYVDVFGCDLVKVFRKLQDDGAIEIITCAATHGFLPLMQNFHEAVRAQVFIGRDHYVQCFGREPAGIWLPECAYVAGIERVLQEANLRWFVLDSHGLMYGNPRPQYAIYAPCYTPAGPAAFSRDRDSSRQVWSAEEGYPGDPAYRDFYRDIGFDLSLDYLAPFMPNRTRKFTGLKYHRITGPTAQKDYYNREWAMAAADSHAGNFLHHRIGQVGHLSGIMDKPPIVLCPFDAELFGHWWFEGPEFLNLFIRKAVYDQQQFRLTTPSRYLESHPRHQVLVPSASSWGHRGYWEVWLDDSNTWIYPHLHMAARRMAEVARTNAETADPLKERALRQLARELLLAQASDWAFLMKTGTAREYATRRTKDHILRFTRLYDQTKTDTIDVSFLENCEWRDNIFPDLNWRYYLENND